jgi:type IV pilus assembly protein PilO
VLRSSGVQIQKFNPEGSSAKEHYVENRYSIAVNSGYHMLGYLFAEIANFNYPTAITNLRMSRYSGIAAELQKAETHGWTPITVSVSFNLTTYTSKKVAQ